MVGSAFSFGVGNEDENPSLAFGEITGKFSVFAKQNDGV